MLVFGVSDCIGQVIDTYLPHYVSDKKGMVGTLVFILLCELLIKGVELHKEIMYGLFLF